MLHTSIAIHYVYAMYICTCESCDVCFCALVRKWSKYFAMFYVLYMHTCMDSYYCDIVAYAIWNTCTMYKYMYIGKLEVLCEHKSTEIQSGLLWLTTSRVMIGSLAS